MASPGNQHCANCIGTLSFPVTGDAAVTCPFRPGREVDVVNGYSLSKEKIS